MMTQTAPLLRGTFELFCLRVYVLCMHGQGSYSQTPKMAKKRSKFFWTNPSEALVTGVWEMVALSMLFTLLLVDFFA